MVPRAASKAHSVPAALRCAGAAIPRCEFRAGRQCEQALAALERFVAAQLEVARMARARLVRASVLQHPAR